MPYAGMSAQVFTTEPCQHGTHETCLFLLYVSFAFVRGLKSERKRKYKCKEMEIFKFRASFALALW